VSRYRFIEVEKVNHAVRTLCRVLQVSRAAYYHWSIHPLSARASADLALTERIAAIHARSRQTYGAPRVHAELQVCGNRHGRKRVARLMHAAGLAGRIPKRYRHTAVADPLTVIPDLVRRDFTPTHPDQLWVGDITYIRTWEGWLYLATLLDCFSRRVVGWAMADHLRTELPLGALHMALARRSLTGTLIHHTDRGCQGEFKWLSQHMTSEVLRWESPSVDDQIEPDVRKCALRADRQAGSESTSSASGQRSPRDLRARTLPGHREWHQRWGADGSAKLAGCEHFLLRRSPVATSPSPSVKRSPYSAPRSAGSGRSLARLAVPLRRSRGSCVGTRPLVVASSSIEPRPRSGMRIAVPSARRTPSSRRTHHSASTSRNG
jgi:transposase InsO family protein